MGAAASAQKNNDQTMNTISFVHRVHNMKIVSE